MIDKSGHVCKNAFMKLETVEQIRDLKLKNVIQLN